MQDWLNNKVKKSRKIISSNPDVYPIFWTHIYLV